MDFLVALSLQVPDGQASSDEGSGDLEVYGDVSARALLDADVPDDVFDEAILFDRSGGNDFLTIRDGQTVEIGSAVLAFSSFDEALSGMEFESRIIERDPGRSGDDNMGTRSENLQFRTPTFADDGTPTVDLLVGRHVLTHGGNGAQVNVILDVQLLN